MVDRKTRHLGKENSMQAGSLGKNTIEVAPPHKLVTLLPPQHHLKCYLFSLKLNAGKLPKNVKESDPSNLFFDRVYEM